MLVMAIREEDWAARWDQLIEAARSKLGSAAELARASGLNYHHLMAVKKQGSRKIGAKTLVRLCRAIDMGADSTDEMVYMWLALKAQRQGEGRALIRTVEELQRMISKGAQSQEEALAAQQKVRSLVVRHFLEELAEEDD